MDAFPTAKALIVSGCSLARAGYFRYPIFTLKGTDFKFISDMRDFLSQLNIVCPEVILPGIGGCEVGFACHRSEVGLIAKSANTMPSELQEQWCGWLSSPALNAIPEDVHVSDFCFQEVERVLQRRAARVENQGARTLYCLNLVTEEIAKVEVDYENQTFSPDRDISGWKQFGIFEGDFLRVSSCRSAA